MGSTSSGARVRVGTEPVNADILDFLAAHRRTRVEVIAERLGEAIQRANPSYRTGGLVPDADLRRSCHDNVDRVLCLLGRAFDDGGAPPTPGRPEASDPSRQTGERRAEQGLPLDEVLGAFRIGGRLVWDDLVEVAASEFDPGALPTLLMEIGTRLWEIIDSMSGQVALAYHLRERALVRADEQLRAELWEGLLRGRGHEAGFAHEFGRMLDLPPNADYVVVVADGLDPVRARRSVSPHASAWTRRVGCVVGLVSVRPGSDGPVHAAVAALAVDRPVGTSMPVRGLAEAEVGFRQAMLALRAAGAAAGLVRFGETLPEALLLSSPDVTRLLVSTWLGPVLDLRSDESVALLDTLRAWVATGGSTTRTATLVHCHRNTIINRLRRVTELTGHPMTNHPPPVELALALRAVELGPPA